jgi:hypothetical protein
MHIQVGRLLVRAPDAPLPRHEKLRALSIELSGGFSIAMVDYWRVILSNYFHD